MSSHSIRGVGDSTLSRLQMLKLRSSKSSVQLAAVGYLKLKVLFSRVSLVKYNQMLLDSWGNQNPDQNTVLEKNIN